MDYGPLVLHYKQLFVGAHGKGVHLPADNFLEMAARMVVYLREKGQQVEEMANESLYLGAVPSDIGAEIDPEGKIRIWLEFQGHGNYRIRDVWTGRFEYFLREFFDYKEVNVIGEEALGRFNLEQELDKLLLISSQFRNAFPKTKEIVDRFEKELENLYGDTWAELASIFLK